MLQQYQAVLGKHAWRRGNDHERLRQHHELPKYPALLHHFLQRHPHVHLCHHIRSLIPHQHVHLVTSCMAKWPLQLTVPQLAPISPMQGCPQLICKPMKCYQWVRQHASVANLAVMRNDTRLIEAALSGLHSIRLPH